MYKTAFCKIILVCLFSCCVENITVAQEKILFDTEYQPAVFSDPNRVEKIKKSFSAIDNIYKKLAIDNHFPGIAFGLVVDGKLVHTFNYGYIDIKKKIPVTSSSLFRIASMSKSFTAMAILKLRDEGKLNLDDPAYLYIPELKNQKYSTADSPPITIRLLLTHGAGFPEDNPWGDRQLADTDKEFIEFLKKQLSFSNPPGIAYEYSNLGFALLGKIITKISGMRYQDYIRNNIWKPLGMKTSEWEYGNVAPDKLAHGYRWLNEIWKEEELLHDTPDGSWGAMGSMISSVDEFANYMALHLSAWPPNNSKEMGPVKRSSVREMHHPWRFNGFDGSIGYVKGRICSLATAYAYGLRWTSDCAGRVNIAHSGGLPGFGSQWRIMPDYGIGIVAFANRTYAGFGDANLRILDTIIAIAGLKPRALPPSIILKKRKDELLKMLPDWNNAQQSGIFAENFFADFPIDSLRKEARQIFKASGEIISVKEMQAENQLRGSFILEGQRQDILVYFTLSPENPALIQEYKIELLPGK